MGERVDGLAARLRKGGRKTAEIFGSLSDDQWEMALYEGPPAWTVRDLLAHFLSAEEGLLRIGQDIAAGGTGAPEGFDYDGYNAAEQARLADLSPDELLAGLEAARQATIVWVADLEEITLDRMGHHPALGNITLENFITAIYGHQLMHVRELRALLRSA
ncbi:MAG: DinB family protein [Chloroflexi bacterium]|nr:DinB family protein [Chloroflexota bacterium]